MPHPAASVCASDYLTAFVRVLRSRAETKQKMTFLPKHRLSRIAAALWLMTCVALLLVTLSKQYLHADERSALTPLRHLVPVYFLGFPSSHLAVVAASKIKLALYFRGEVAPSLFSECVSLWIGMVTLGYVQWFILLPWVSGRCWQACNTLFNRNDRSNP